MHRRPIVSVIIPIYNGSTFLRETIESILCQSFCDFELLLIDDGSTDDSPDIARSYVATDDRIILITNSRNHGVVHALNAGLCSASGTFIARLDHDDVAIAHRLEAQVQYLLTHPSVVIVGSNMLGISETGEVLGEIWSPEQPDQIRFAMLLNSAIADPTVMCRAGAIAQHSLCYHSLNVAAEDYAMWATIIQYGDAYNLRDRLTYYRLHANQMSYKLAATQVCSADRISAAQIRAVDPDIILTSSERQVLDHQFRLCVRLWSRKNPDQWTLASLIDAASVRLAAALSPDARDVLDSIRERGLLQRLVRSFTAAHPTSDPVLSLLSENQ